MTAYSTLPHRSVLKYGRLCVTTKLLSSSLNSGSTLTLIFLLVYGNNRSMVGVTTNSLFSTFLFVTLVAPNFYSFISGMGSCWLYFLVFSQ